MEGRSLRRGSLRKAFLAVLRHPSIWATAVRQAVVLAPRGWWKRRPFLPVPDRAYLRFRMVTAYGSPDRQPEADDVVTYLRWCRGWRTVTG